jgi:hypothetical protein
MRPWQAHLRCAASNAVTSTRRSVNGVRGWQLESRDALTPNFSAAREGSAYLNPGGAFLAHLTHSTRKGPQAKKDRPKAVSQGVHPVLAGLIALAVPVRRAGLRCLY